MDCRKIMIALLIGSVALISGCGGGGGGNEDTGADGSSDSDADADADAGGDTDSDADTDSDTDADADTDTDTDGDTDSNSGTDSGTDADAGPDASPGNGLFDMEAIRDPSTAKCTFSNHRIVFSDVTPLDVWDLTYYSWESVDGTLNPILIRGYAAKPMGMKGPMPGIVNAHGLGGYADEGALTAMAALLRMFVVAYSGPAAGNVPANTSEGIPPMDAEGHGHRLFDTVPDVRGSWFWGHAAAGMRAITCLDTRSEVDAKRIGMTGFSGGSIATLLAAGADNRVAAAVPISGTGAWDVAAQSPDAWENDLLTQTELTKTSPEWLALVNDLFAPAVMIGYTHAKIMMLDGSADEFFPLNAFMATYAAVPGAEKRISLIANYDHGCYISSGVETSQTIADRSSLRTNGAHQLWFNHWFNTNKDYSCVPPGPPVATATAQDSSSTLVAATVDSGGSCYTVENVAVWMSNDDAFVYSGVVLDKSGGVYQKVVPLPLQANTVWFVDVQYKTKNPLFPGQFSVSSQPGLPNDFVPHIRVMGECT
ncbi:MAG: hypothetical protein PHU25_16510 [Deltaproteobacteria bacterium]|nr:hypothetical protein [Deltaproteobacteria bacterium]